MNEVRISDQARADLMGVWLFISEDSLAAADRQVATILRTYETLAQFREMGEVREDLRGDLRSFTVGRYVIFYHPIDSGIEIVRVVSGARDIGGLF
jgi:toxin ParE1/3/4